MIRAAASAVSCTSATAKGSLRDANSKTVGANSAYWAGVALVANETIFAGSCRKRSSISSESFVSSARPSNAHSVRRRSSRPILCPPASSEISAPHPPTSIRWPLTIASPLEPVPSIAIRHLHLGGHRAKQCRRRLRVRSTQMGLVLQANGRTHPSTQRRPTPNLRAPAEGRSRPDPPSVLLPCLPLGSILLLSPNPSGYSPGH